MKPPIVIEEPGSVYIYESVKEAELDLEPIDVRENRYVAYDSEGRLLKLVPTEPIITIEPGERSPTHSTELREALVSALEYLGVPQDWLAGASLQQLVEKGVEYKLR